MDNKGAYSLKEAAVLQLARPVLTQLQPFEPALPDLPIEKSSSSWGRIV